MNNNLIDIFKYFGNDDIVRVNRDREFTVDEMLTIIKYSKEVAMKDRIKDMLTLSKYVDKAKIGLVTKYINYQREKLEFVKNIDGKKFEFTIFLGKNGAKNTYTSLGDVLALGYQGDVYINEPSIEEYDIDMYVKDGVVTDIHLDFLEHANFYDMGADDVKLNSPFKQFDVVNIGTERYVVARRDEVNMCWNFLGVSWIDMDIPVYKVADDGAIYADRVDDFPCYINELYRVDAEYMTSADAEMLKFIKAHHS